MDSVHRPQKPQVSPNDQTVRFLADAICGSYQAHAKLYVVRSLPLSLVHRLTIGSSLLFIGYTRTISYLTAGFIALPLYISFPLFVSFRCFIRLPHGPQVGRISLCTALLLSLSHLYDQLLYAIGLSFHVIIVL